MHILIVDDEYYIVQGIIEGIEWDALGIDKISSAFSMSQAQEVFGPKRWICCSRILKCRRATGSI